MNEFLNKYKYIIIGAILGVLIACLFIFIGFFKSIIVLFFTFIGGLLGYLLSNYIKK